MKRIRSFALLLLLISQAGAGEQSTGNQANEPGRFFRDFVGLTDDQIKDIRVGKAVAKVLDSGSPDEVFVFGSVFVKSTPEQYLKFASDIDSLRKVPSYLAIQKFSDPPQPADLAQFTLDESDIKELQHCTPGHCDVQLPTEAMEEFQRSVDWSAPDRSDQANRLARQMALTALQRYQQGGNVALGTYRDKNHPADVAETFGTLLSRMKALPAYLPALHRYLLEYPNAPSDNVNSQFYWEKVNFGLKPTLRIVQAVVYHGRSAAEPAYAVAIKQLYSSHYFQTAMDLTVCLRDNDPANKDGFYLITVKGSKQAGLTGFKGSILRKVAVDKTRSSLQKALTSIKQKLEGQND
jgi:hypothetical protein